MTGPSAIGATGIHKTFGHTRAVAGASLSVGHGELVALLGPSGSGKTTLLRVIAGFEVPDAGTVTIGDRLVAGGGAWEEPDRRRVGMVFQDGALFRERQRLLLVVRDEQGAGRRGPQDRRHLLPQRHPQAGVERGERLVEQHDLGLVGQGAGQRDALALAARQLVGI